MSSLDKKLQDAEVHCEERHLESLASDKQLQDQMSHHNEQLTTLERHINALEEKL